MPSNWNYIVLALAATAQWVRAAAPTTIWRYEVKTETSMPHLEENLRYAVMHETRCLTEQDLASAFSALAHPSLAGCKLHEQRREGDTISFVLECNGGSGTTGTATWLLAARALRGTLDVKLGGKNMTFSQRVTATVVGECSAPVASE